LTGFEIPAKGYYKQAREDFEEAYMKALVESKARKVKEAIDQKALDYRANLEAQTYSEWWFI